MTAPSNVAMQSPDAGAKPAAVKVGDRHLSGVVVAVTPGGWCVIELDVPVVSLFCPGKPLRFVTGVLMDDGVLYSAVHLQDLESAEAGSPVPLAPGGVGVVFPRPV